MNKPVSFKKILFSGLTAAVIAAAASASSQAAEVSYDRYASLYAPGAQKAANASRLADDFLTYPFELVRWPLDKILVFAEEKRIVTKAEWLYDTSVEHGFTPYLGWIRYGGELDVLRAARQKVNFPDTTLKGWVDKHEDRFFAGGKTGVERIMDSPIRAFGLIEYEHRDEEHFYGIGPDTSKGEGTSYKMEQTLLEGSVGYSQDPSFSADLKVSYRNINIGNGHDGGRGVIDTTFPNTRIPGLDGDEIVATGIDIVRDTRNHQDLSSRGHFARFAYSINEGLFNSEARYLKGIFEYSRYIPIFSDRRVFVFHLYGEDNNPLQDRRVPFHDMAKLGGYGGRPSLSNTLRAYDENRFFDNDAFLMNLEYRYTIYEYRDWKADAVLFWDEGQVFKKISKFQFQDFESSYGVGFRLSFLNNVLLSVELAHGDEGTDFYVKNRSPF